MTTKQDPRSPTKKRKDAAYAALPALRVHRPLRAIKKAFDRKSWRVTMATDLHKSGGRGLQEFALTNLA